MRLIGLAVVLSLVLVPLAAEGQETPKIHRIGVLSVPPAYLAAFDEAFANLATSAVGTSSSRLARWGD
jgi:hypothetical protein